MFRKKSLFFLVIENFGLMYNVPKFRVLLTVVFVNKGPLRGQVTS